MCAKRVPLGIDSQTSARIMVSTGGVVTDNRSWKAFGEPIQTGTTETPYGYAAGAAYYVDLADLFNAWNRWMKPSMKQWRSVDPIGFDGGSWNPYQYVRNEPVRFVDASGLQRACDTRTEAYCNSASKKYCGLNYAENCICSTSRRICDDLIKKDLLGCGAWSECMNACIFECWSDPSKCGSSQAKQCWADYNRNYCKHMSRDQYGGVKDRDRCCRKGVECEQTGYTPCYAKCSSLNIVSTDDLGILCLVVPFHCSDAIRRGAGFVGKPDFPFSGSQNERIAAAQLNCCTKMTWR